MGRARTTKTLSKRIELQYYRRPHPFRTLRKRLSAGAAGAALLAIVWALVPSHWIVWSAGGLTASHAVFQGECGLCHGPGARPDAQRRDLQVSSRRAGGVTDEACQFCHAGPAHQAGQRREPSCAACHLEHREDSLVRIDDAFCLECHADLPAASREPTDVEERIVSFPEAHPEFDPIAIGRDSSRLRLNHKLHLAENIRGPDGPVTLDCGSCHRPDTATALMLPVTYEADCASCHPLVIDSGLDGAPVVLPHGDPNAALNALYDHHARVALSAPEPAAATDPAADALARQRARNPGIEEPAYVAGSLPAGSKRAYVVERVARDVQLLERKTCAYCHGRGHAMTGEILARSAPPPVGESMPPPAPMVPEPAEPAVWMPRSIFSHRAHRALACLFCHPAALTSEQTSDLLLPAKQLCATCHRQGRQAAPATCVTCHRYHPPESDPLDPSILRLAGQAGVPRGASMLQ